MQKLTTEALDATELGHVGLHVGFFPYNYVDSFMSVSLDGAASLVTLFLFVRFCVH